MTVRRGRPEASFEDPENSDGWYYQLRGEKDWVGPFPRANEAQAAYAAAKRSRRATTGQPIPATPPRSPGRRTSARKPWAQCSTEEKHALALQMTREARSEGHCRAAYEYDEELDMIFGDDEGLGVFYGYIEDPLAPSAIPPTAKLRARERERAALREAAAARRATRSRLGRIWDEIVAFAVLAFMALVVLAVAAVVFAWVKAANDAGPKCPPGQEEVYDPPYASYCQ